MSTLHPGNGNTGDDIERGNSINERGKSIVSLSGFQGMDEYTALQRYIVSYRDPRTNPKAEEPQAKKNPWWAFWRPAHENANTTPSTAAATPDEWLTTDIRNGLSTTEVETRRKKAGFNELTSEKESMLKKFLGYFNGPVLWVMEAAALLAAGLADWIDFGVICGILLLNAIVGWYQEKQAADVVASLRGDIAMKATVVRDGGEQNILAREIVPGDIVVIEEGLSVPADVQLICDYDHPEDYDLYLKLKEEDKFHTESDPDDEKGGDDDEDEENPVTQGHSIVACDQSAITGESLAVDKYMGEVAYYTTGCKRGKAYGIATCSARNSFVGRTASLVQGAKDQGHFKAIMNSIGISLLVIVMFWILAAWVGGFFRHLRLAEARAGQSDSTTLLHYALILLIVGVPVGLPVVTTTTLAVGAAYLAKQKAIVQKLTAIESLAGVDVLCSDKTGTLTANMLSIREPYVAEGQDVNWMMAVAALASSHNLKSLDPIDKVTILTVRRYPEARKILGQGWRTEKFTPFDPVSKRITAICYLGEDKYVCAKGAPKAILTLSNCDEETARLFREKAADFARRGFRSLGVAFQKNDGDWILLGLLSMFDPPREDTAQTIIEAQQLGVPVKMLTGDAIAIAKETCKMLALGTKVYNSTKLIHGGLTGTTQHDLVERADGFAEVFPEHKYQVVEMLQQRGHLTAMTGDGVNDAPSLKKADCGIAVEGASEAAQAAADIVFLAPGLSTIVLAIKIARQIFQRMKSYIQYRIALCLHLEIYLVTSMIIINETIRADLIVFIALFADLATVAVAYDNAYSEERPVEWQLPKIWVISVILGILLATGTWVIRGTLFLKSGGIVQRYGSIQEILFLEVSLTENWLIFVTRGGKTWPSFQLVGAILGVDAVATLFCLFGWISGPPYNSSPPSYFVQRADGWTDITTVVVIWGYSIGVTIVIAIVYFLLNKIQWLDELGRKDRNKKDPVIENMIAALGKLALEHGTDKHGTDRYVLAMRAVEEEEDE
ncbi:plasma membrane ATPase 1 [Pleomassaria siparia CBS 279.74]|uniref:Plasma membrane ATPase n=1 Tax=Pleomassaria siparia CBS 279.74 TaxID=1314801 RepID=A0A6G1KD49_9PLEO|nr:plasma membrane ATPase 1 [Pleomassaria siparia CBS 279.74]